MNDLIKPGAVFNRYRESIASSTYSNKEGQSFGKPYGSGNVGDSTYGGQWTQWCDTEIPSKSSLSVTGTEIWGKKPEMNGADGENDWNLHADFPKPSNCIPRPLHASFKSNDDVYSLLQSTSGESDASSLGKGATNKIWASNGNVSQAKEIRDLFDPAKCDKNTVDLMEQFGLLNVRDERIGATNLTGDENQNQGPGWNNFPLRNATRAMGIGEDLGLECWQAKMNDGQKLSIDEEKNISMKRLESGLIGQRRDSNVSSEGSGCGKIDRRDVWDRQDSWNSGRRNEDNWKNSWDCPDQAMPPVPFPNSNTGTEVWNKTENHPLLSSYPTLPPHFDPSVPPPPLPFNMPPQLNPSAINNVNKLQSILNSCPSIRSKSIHDSDLCTNSDSQWSASNPGTLSWNGSHPGQPWSSTGKSNENLNAQTLYRCLGQAMMSGRSSHPPHSQTQTRSRWIQELASMGFKKEDAQRALINSNMDFECALGELVFKTGHAADLLKLNSYQQQQPIHQQQRQPQFDSCRDDPRTAALLAGSQPVGGPSLSPTQLAEFVKLLSNPVGAYIRDQAIKPNFSNQMSKSPFGSNLLSANPRLPTLSSFGSPMLSGFRAPSLSGFGPPSLSLNDADPIQLALDRLSLTQNQPPSAELMKELLKLTEQPIPNPHADLARPSSLLGGESISRQSVSGGSSPMIYGLPNDLPFGNVSTDGIPPFTNDIASYTDGIRSFTLPDGSVFRMPDRNSANSSLLSPSANKQSPRSAAMMAPFGQASDDLAAYVGGLQSSNQAPKSSSLKIKEFIPGIPWQCSTTRGGAENQAGGGISPLNASNSPKPDDIMSSSNVGEAGYHTSTSESEVSSLPSLSTNWIEIKNVPSQFDVESLKSLCVVYGPLKSFTFQASKGTVLVGYAEREDAFAAQQALDCYMVGDVQISVNFVMDWHVAASHSEKKLPPADSLPQMGYMTPGGLWIPPADAQPEDFNDQAETEEGWNEDGIYDENYTCEGWDLQAELPADEPEGGYFSPVENPDKSA